MSFYFKNLFSSPLPGFSLFFFPLPGFFYFSLKTKTPSSRYAHISRVTIQSHTKPYVTTLCEIIIHGVSDSIIAGKIKSAGLAFPLLPALNCRAP